MTVHKKYTSKRTKSKIILPKKPYTTLLPKKRKSTKNINRTDKIYTEFYNKMKFTSLLKRVITKKYLNKSIQSPYSLV
jgi:hypothetical protein